MKVVQCCPFYNENLIARIKIDESRGWVDELHITECNRSFTFRRKPFSFAFANEPMVRYHRIDGNEVFQKNRWEISRNPWFVHCQRYSWENDARQRNSACSFIEVDDNDIVILSDLDEIIDRRFADRIVDETRKHGIITLKLRFTMFYFNLFSRNWGGPPDYSYRTFIMTGRYFKSLDVTSDQLRKMGEHGKLLTTVHCLDEFGGFHHSWVGDAEFVAKKLKAYAHDAADHDGRVFSRGKRVNVDYVRECIETKRSIFGPAHQLYVDDSVSFLQTVAAMRSDMLKGHFI